MGPEVALLADGRAGTEAHVKSRLDDDHRRANRRTTLRDSTLRSFRLLPRSVAVAERARVPERGADADATPGGRTCALIPRSRHLAEADRPHLSPLLLALCSLRSRELLGLAYEFFIVKAEREPCVAATALEISLVIFISAF